MIGRSIRLPADLTDESELVRLSAQSAAETPTTKFFRRNQLRVAAREAFVKTSNDAALRRAELRRVRPSRGPFRVGDYVFFYDQSDQMPGPKHWRGVARVVGHEGSRTVWIAHRGLLVACSPEHLAHADEEEIRGWMVTSNETTLMDATPAAGGTIFLDIRTRPIPPAEGFPEEAPALTDRHDKETPRALESEYGPSEPPPQGEQPPQPSDKTFQRVQHPWLAWS